jgi:hypothetical protein
LRRTLAILLVLAATEASADGARIESVGVYEGLCEASGAVALPEGSFGERFLMVNNDDAVIRVYAVGTPEASAESGSTALGTSLQGRGPIDIEAATWLDGEALFLGSLDEDKDGDADHWQFLSVAMEEDSQTATVKGGTASADRLLAGLAALDDDLAEAIGESGQASGAAASGAGIDLEGMSVTADGASLFLGFRNPVPEGQSVLVKLLNPKPVLFQDAEPAFAPPIRLDLGGRGIRSLEYSPAAGAYFIVAGPTGAEGDFDLYRWIEGSDPVPVPGAREALASLGDFAPEGLIIDQSGKRLQLFSDNEACETDTFRSAILTLE